METFYTRTHFMRVLVGEDLGHSNRLEMSNSDWLATDYDYSGYAEAIFDEPHVVLRGPASVRPDADGHPRVEITVDQSTPEIRTQFDLMEVRYGSRRVQGGKLIAVGGHSENKVRAVVSGEKGVFQCGPDWAYDLSLPPDGPLTLRINPFRSEYTVVTRESDAWFVLPLLGWIPEFPMPASATRRHQLSFDDGFGSPQGGCIIFELCGKMAFIQQLPDTKTLGAETVFTAAAVLPAVDAEMINPWGWFLTAFLRLLELAGGAQIGVPWIEVRDEGGLLAKRLHCVVGSSRHATGGYAVLPKAHHWAGGEYLTVALSSPQAKEPFFSIALRHCIRAGLPGLTLDDQLDHLVRALECLCLRYGFGKQDLTDGLDAELAKKIGTVLKDARGEINGLARGITEIGARSQVTRIAERTQAAHLTDRSFGLAVESLARHFGLQDSEVLAPYYASHKLPGRNWVGALSYYRGAVFHEGFLDIDFAGTPVGEVLGFILHLHDLVTRVLLKVIGYPGKYQPRLIRTTAAETADWFKPGIQVDRLLSVPTLGVK